MRESLNVFSQEPDLSENLDGEEKVPDALDDSISSQDLETEEHYEVNLIGGETQLVRKIGVEDDFVDFVRLSGDEPVKGVWKDAATGKLAVK